MRRGLLWTVGIAGVLLGAAGCRGEQLLEERRTWRFEEDTAESPAAGWIVPRVAYGADTVPAGRWIIDRDPRAPSPAHLLRQTTTHFASDHHNVAVADTRPLRDFRLVLQLRAYPGARAARITEEFAGRGLEVPAGTALAGSEGGGGPVFRYTDAGNYYVIRWSPRESTVNLYAVHHGRRTKLAGAPVNTKADDVAWHELEVACRGPRIVCAFDGVQVLEHEDYAHDIGRVGLWTKADASTGFDDVQLIPLAPPKATTKR